MSEKVQKVIPERIREFIKEHHVLTMASGSNGEIWCANAFYAYCEGEDLLIITSEEHTKHIQIAISSALNGELPVIAGSIVLETEIIGKIRGLQFTAVIEKVIEPLSEYKFKYLKRFPYAILKGGDLWLLRLIELKYTDNRLGFGKKILVKLS
jgi:hypothetical protein